MTHQRISAKARRLGEIFALAGLALFLWASPIQAQEQYWIYTVRPGDSIWSLTEKYCTSVRYWRRIQALNNVSLDRQIPPGTKLRFPMSILKHEPAQAMITQITGTAQLVRAGSNSPIPLPVNANLRTGDRVIVGPDSNANVRFADGSNLLILSDSEVVMDTLSAWGTTGMVDTRIRLKGGRVDTHSEPARGPGSRYQIITPAAVAAVRGTDFRVAAEAQAPVSRNEVLEGEVGVGDSERAMLVPAGFGLITEIGKEQEPPRPLLPAPGLSGNDRLQRRLPLQITWPRIAGAVAYRLQIAPNRQFRALIHDRRVEAELADVADLPDGRYAMRVRGIDEVGLEGLNAVHEFEVAARPFAPERLNPVEDAVLNEDRPRFSWSKVDGARAYRFQLATDTGFDAMITESVSTENALTLKQPLQPGSYHWRIASITGDNRQGPFQKPGQFAYRPVPGTPELREPVIEESHLVFHWHPVANANHYQIQFARDPRFREMLLERRVPETHVELQRPPSRRYYYRIRAWGAEGDPGEFSPTRAVDVPPLSHWPLLIFALPLLLLL